MMSAIHALDEAWLARADREIAIEWVGRLSSDDLGEDSTGRLALWLEV